MNVPKTRCYTHSILAALAFVVVAAGAPAPAANTSFVGGYLLLGGARSGTTVGYPELDALSKSAATIPVTRLYLAFVSPSLVYAPGSNTLKYAGLGLDTTGDYGFAKLKGYISAFRAAGVETFISMGGWNYNCYPSLYMRYSVGGYGTSTPNFWKIQKYGGGSVDGCTESNAWCYVCEPPSENTTYESFSIFPEPSKASTWATAKAYIEKGASGAEHTPIWNEDMIPGSPWTDPATGQSTVVPGNGLFNTMGRDPYQDLVLLAKDLGAAGVDIDYEEMWHADKFKYGNAPGPFTLPQTIYKYSAIVYDVMSGIKANYPTCKLSTAAAAVGAWSGSWWGGNLKGVWLQSKQMYPEIISFMSTGANAGGVNVMTYDLSKNEHFHECPDPTDCPLEAQVEFYMATYAEANIPANVGFEIGRPAYPDVNEDNSDQLPLTNDALATIAKKLVRPGGAAFFWEMYKAQNATCFASPQNVAQVTCANVFPGSKRCEGTIPNPFPTPPVEPCPPGPAPSPPPPPGPPPPPPPGPSKTCHAVPGSGATDQWCDENCNHDPPNCPANLCKCDNLVLE